MHRCFLLIFRISTSTAGNVPGPKASEAEGKAVGITQLCLLLLGIAGGLFLV
jgi:hypothetical protein